MVGGVRPRHRAWARAAQRNVPLPDARISIVSGYDPEYVPALHTVFLPEPGRGGWTYYQEHVLFLHELGHVFDQMEMTPAARDRFRAAAGTTCRWWARHCFTLNRRSGERIDLPPGEMFAEAYEACALGMTRRQVDDSGAVTYGWDPPNGSDELLCRVIREAGVRSFAAYLFRARLERS